ncbi:hypothetical protein Tco_0468259, partial [Tanacetum coccineum]
MLLGEVNATSISLVPKLETPSKVSDFRPVTCCNVIYKCISKILTNRIKKALCEVLENGAKKVSFKIDIGTGYSLKDKNKAKPDKTEHEIGKSVKNRGQ